MSTRKPPLSRRNQIQVKAVLYLVVGEQPTIVPGDAFTYTSGAILETAVGTMEGFFEMVSADGEIFKAKIPVFTLLNPGALH